MTSYDGSNVGLLVRMLYAHLFLKVTLMHIAYVYILKTYGKVMNKCALRNTLRCYISIIDYLSVKEAHI